MDSEWIEVEWAREIASFSSLDHLSILSCISAAPFLQNGFCPTGGTPKKFGDCPVEFAAPLSGQRKLLLTVLGFLNRSRERVSTSAVSENRVIMLLHAWTLQLPREEETNESYGPIASAGLIFREYNTGIASDDKWSRDISSSEKRGWSNDTCNNGNCKRNLCVVNIRNIARNSEELSSLKRTAKMDAFTASRAEGKSKLFQSACIHCKASGVCGFCKGQPFGVPIAQPVYTSPPVAYGAPPSYPQTFQPSMPYGQPTPYGQPVPYGQPMPYGYPQPSVQTTYTTVVHQQPVNPFIALESGPIALRSHHGAYLSARENGQVQQMPHKQAWEGWSILPTGSPGYYYLRSHHGNYLSGNSNETAHLMPHMKEWEVWQFIPLNNGKFAARSIHGTHLRAAERGPVNLTKSLQDWEQWSVERF
ncbi:hypothetical protein PROFUN_02721 [Planoprotostelium fungivorum]|uniref:Uncharacterized protein n=1 Tax=Planoprotostelium fungivorum TaxID=1890364 RepID=A0A2P6NVI4_9EUKA|nr:hypothetical protein PROFUN_02721 [Planoprotostelium fungivorum]